METITVKQLAESEQTYTDYDNHLLIVRKEVIVKYGSIQVNAISGDYNIVYLGKRNKSIVVTPETELSIALNPEVSLLSVLDKYHELREHYQSLVNAIHYIQDNDSYRNEYNEWVWESKSVTILNDVLNRAPYAVFGHHGTKWNLLQEDKDENNS